MSFSGLLDSVAHVITALVPINIGKIYTAAAKIPETSLGIIATGRSKGLLPPINPPIMKNANRRSKSKCSNGREQRTNTRHGD
ncbi:unnamed protein product [marine sediment metagenome]|uniref:Uncharacterized protein n=1 Tax=marine sediment metagenome TaxID=412755 RepID=X1A985_9ZZZZ